MDADPTATPVVVDPYIGRHLRVHQREGVQFMYDCVMGMREAGRNGCILADDMGLGAWPAPRVCKRDLYTALCTSGRVGQQRRLNTLLHGSFRS